MSHLHHLVAVVACGLVLAACGAADTSARGATVDPAAADGPSRTDYPLTVENCGVDVVIEAAPERVVMLNTAPVSTLAAVGVLDRVVARAGVFSEAYYDDEVNATIAGITSLGGEDLDASGHFQISQEAILAQQPDLVLGLPDGVTRESLGDAGIPVLLEPAMCPAGIDEPGFDDVTSQVALYGRVFDQQEQAARSIADLEQRVQELTASASGAGRTAAVLYPTVGGGAGYAYGNRSMAHPQLEAAGLTNVFGDVDERVFEVTLEALLDRDPDVLVLLHGDGDPGAVEAEIRGLPGAESLTAVREDHILVQLFNFTEPPTPLSVDGLGRIVAAFGDGA